MSIRYNRQEKQKRRGSEREPPAHKSNRLWLLDFSPDQVHGLPLQGASFKVASFDSTLYLIVSKERILSMGKSLKKNHFHFFRAQPRSRHIIIGIVSVADASLRRMYTFEWNCSRSGREYCQKGGSVYVDRSERSGCGCYNGRLERFWNDFCRSSCRRRV